MAALEIDLCKQPVYLGSWTLAEPQPGDGTIFKCFGVLKGCVQLLADYADAASKARTSSDLRDCMPEARLRIIARRVAATSDAAFKQVSAYDAIICERTARRDRAELEYPTSCNIRLDIGEKNLGFIGAP